MKDYVDGQYRIVPGENGTIAYRKDGNAGFNAQFNIIGAGSNALTVQTDYLSTVTKNFVCFNRLKSISELLNSSTGIVINLNNVFVCDEAQLKELNARNSVSLFVQQMPSRPELVGYEVVQQLFIKIAECNGNELYSKAARTYANNQQNQKSKEDKLGLVKDILDHYS